MFVLIEGDIPEAISSLRHNQIGLILVHGESYWSGHNWKFFTNPLQEKPKIFHNMETLELSKKDLQAKVAFWCSPICDDSTNRLYQELVKNELQ